MIVDARNLMSDDEVDESFGSAEYVIPATRALLGTPPRMRFRKPLAPFKKPTKTFWAHSTRFRTGIFKLPRLRKIAKHFKSWLGKGTLARKSRDHGTARRALIVRESAGQYKNSFVATVKTEKGESSNRSSHVALADQDRNPFAGWFKTERMEPSNRSFFFSPVDGPVDGPVNGPVDISVQGSVESERHDKTPFADWFKTEQESSLKSFNFSLMVGPAEPLATSTPLEEVRTPINKTEPSLLHRLDANKENISPGVYKSASIFASPGSPLAKKGTPNNKLGLHRLFGNNKGNVSPIQVNQDEAIAPMSFYQAESLHIFRRSKKNNMTAGLSKCESGFGPMSPY